MYASGSGSWICSGACKSDDSVASGKVSFCCAICCTSSKTSVRLTLAEVSVSSVLRFFAADGAAELEDDEDGRGLFLDLGKILCAVEGMEATAGWETGSPPFAADSAIACEALSAADLRGLPLLLRFPPVPPVMPVLFSWFAGSGEACVC